MYCKLCLTIPLGGHVNKLFTFRSHLPHHEVSPQQASGTPGTGCVYEPEPVQQQLTAGRQQQGGREGGKSSTSCSRDANSETSYGISHEPITVAPSEGRVAGCGFYTPNSSSKFYTLSTLIMSV